MKPLFLSVLLLFSFLCTTVVHSAVTKSYERPGDYCRETRAFLPTGNETKQEISLKKTFGAMGLRGTKLLNRMQWEHYCIGYYSAITVPAYQSEADRLRKQAQKNLSSLAKRTLYREIVSKIEKKDREHLASYMKHVRLNGAKFGGQRSYQYIVAGEVEKPVVLQLEDELHVKGIIFALFLLGLSFVSLLIVVSGVLSERFGIPFFDRVLQLKNPFAA